MMKVNFPSRELVSIPSPAADKLISLGDGDAALLYLLLVARGGMTVREAADVLGRTADEVRGSMSILADCGLISRDDTDYNGGVSAIKDARPEGKAELVRSKTEPSERRGTAKREREQGGAFSYVAQETQKVLGRPLSADDLTRLYGIYDALKLPPDVILLLVHHCAEESKRENGKKPRLSYIEKNAYAWEREGITTLDRAEIHIRKLEEQRSAAGEIKKTLQITDRDLSPSEKTFVDGWLRLGIPPETVALAYDRTILYTKKLSWNYMDSILKKWHESGVKTPEEVSASEAAPRKAASAPASGQKKRAAPNAKDIEQMRKLIERMKQDGDE